MSWTYHNFLVKRIFFAAKKNRLDCFCPNVTLWEIFRISRFPKCFSIEVGLKTELGVPTVLDFVYSTPNDLYSSINSFSSFWYKVNFIRLICSLLSHTCVYNRRKDVEVAHAYIISLIYNQINQVRSRAIRHWFVPVGTLISVDVQIIEIL